MQNQKNCEKKKKNPICGLFCVLIKCHVTDFCNFRLFVCWLMIVFAFLFLNRPMTASRHDDGLKYLFVSQNKFSRSRACILHNITNLNTRVS